jgi:hypothetical protein
MKSDWERLQGKPWWYWVLIALAILIGLYLGFFHSDNPVVDFLSRG